MSSYLEKLKRQVAEWREQRDAARAQECRSLDDRIRDWYEALPPQERRTHYSMEKDLVLLFGASPGSIGSALHRLGWERKRRWSGGQSYSRLWFPPLH